MTSLRELIVPEKIEAITAHQWGTNCQRIYDAWYNLLLENIARIEAEYTKFYQCKEDGFGGRTCTECPESEATHRGLSFPYTAIDRKVSREEVREIERYFLAKNAGIEASIMRRILEHGVGEA
jgi:hypothetical protein